MANYTMTHTGDELDATIENHISRELLAGVGFDFYGANAPDGALACLAQEVSKTTYSLLYAAIGDTWATTGGAPTPAAGNFRLPPQQIGNYGVFSRGVGSSTGVVGAYLDSDNKAHVHSTQSHSHTSPAHNHTSPAHGHTSPAHGHTSPVHGHTASSGSEDVDHAHGQNGHTHVASSGVNDFSHEHSIDHSHTASFTGDAPQQHRHEYHFIDTDSQDGSDSSVARSGSSGATGPVQYTEYETTDTPSGTVDVNSLYTSSGNENNTHAHTITVDSGGDNNTLFESAPHSHSVTVDSNGVTINTTVATINTTVATVDLATATVNSSGVTVDSTGGGETRPKSISVLKCVWTGR